MRTAPLAATLAFLAGAAQARADDTLPAYRARMYAKSAKEVWQAAQDTLAELKLKADKSDPVAQVIVTRATAYGESSVKAPAVTGYEALRFRLHVYVSPYAEPARVHLGSVSELRKPAGGTGTLYNDGVAEEWFLGALERRLGLQGRPIPAAAAARGLLAKELSGQEPCRQQPQSEGGRVEPPRRIKASEVEVLYPGPAHLARSSGPVVLELNLGEDGAVYAIQVLKNPDPELQFRESALGAASLLRYAPTRLLGCPVPTIMTYTLNYKMR